MTKAKMQVLETDVVLFPLKLKQERLISEINNETIEVEKTTLKIDVKKRFARLKKSIRKRSAGIL